MIASRFLAVGMLTVFLSAGPRLAAEPQEYAIKAAFLFNIAQFVEWPEEAFAANEPFIISVLEQNPFGRLLESIVRDQALNGRPVEVRYPRNWEEAVAAESHLLFIPAGVGRNPEFEARLQHTLIVGDSPGFARSGGMIGLVRDGDRVRLEVNRKAMGEAGLRASSRLLGVATIVDSE